MGLENTQNVYGISPTLKMPTLRLDLKAEQELTMALQGGKRSKYKIPCREGVVVMAIIEPQSGRDWGWEES